MIIASLEFTDTNDNHRIDIDIVVDSIVAMSKMSANSIAIRLSNGYVAEVPPTIAMHVSNLWYKNAETGIAQGVYKIAKEKNALEYSCVKL